MTVNETEFQTREWVGVQIGLKWGKHWHNAAIATVVVLLMETFLLVVQFVLPQIIGMGMNLFPSAFFWWSFGLIICIGWPYSFARNELISWHGVGVLTLDTDVSSRSSKEWRYSIFDRGGGPYLSAARDISAGRIVATSAGIQGYITMPWRTIQSVLYKEAERVVIYRKGAVQKVAELLGLNPLVLTFSSSDDAMEFARIAGEYIRGL